jgi:hypothetical protein
MRPGHIRGSALPGDRPARPACSLRPGHRRLVELLPTGSDGRPYLAGFALTHPDLDHCRSFADLLERATIGELWLTPRVFRDNTDGELSEDAQAYCDEAMRRVKKTIASGGVARSGDRVRIIGYDDLLAEDDFKGFPKELLTIPGTPVTTLDGTEHARMFRAFIHSPFKGDSSGRLVILGEQGPDQDGVVWVHVTLSLEGMETRPGGLPLRQREPFRIGIPPTFPFEPPAVHCALPLGRDGARGVRRPALPVLGRVARGNLTPGLPQIRA